MKTAILSLMFILSQHTHALQIHDVQVSPNAINAINISLNTEAVELYYFNSWHYSIVENTIVVEAAFTEGFGSSIAYLNNNFEIPVGSHPAIYHLIVRIYYTDTRPPFDPQNLQDEMAGDFRFPISEPVVLGRLNPGDDSILFYPNPTKSELTILADAGEVTIYDVSAKRTLYFHMTSNTIDLSGLTDGIYYVQYAKGSVRKTKRIVVKK